MELKDHVLHSWMPSNGVPVDVCQQCVATLGTVQQYEAALSQLTFMARWTKDQKSAWHFVEKLIYKPNFDKDIMQNLMNRQSAKEALGTGEIKHEADRLASVFAPTEGDAEGSVEAEPGENPEEGAAVATEDARLMSPISFLPADMAEEQRAIVKKYQDTARRYVSQSVHLMVEPNDEVDVVGALKSWLDTSKALDSLNVEGDGRSIGSKQCEFAT
eukprot:4230139-Amphidinium_carterae.1